jgi:hypothetical protein
MEKNLIISNYQLREFHLMPRELNLLKVIVEEKMQQIYSFQESFSLGSLVVTKIQPLI